MNNKNLFFRNLVNFCLENELDMVSVKSEYNLGDIMKGSISVFRNIPFGVIRQVQTDLMESKTNTKKFYCYWCPQSVFLIWKECWIVNHYTKSYDFIQKFLNEYINDFECKICFGNPDITHFSYCMSCKNSICKTCKNQLSSCPFCRTKW